MRLKVRARYETIHASAIIITKGSWELLPVATSKNPIVNTQAEIPLKKAGVIKNGFSGF
jgi:hypothetical protein